MLIQNQYQDTVLILNKHRSL